jgi:hypothetical protein
MDRKETRKRFARLRNEKRRRHAGKKEYLGEKITSGQQKVGQHWNDNGVNPCKQILNSFLRFLSNQLVDYFVRVDP